MRTLPTQSVGWLVSGNRGRRKENVLVGRLVIVVVQAKSPKVLASGLGGKLRENQGRRRKAARAAKTSGAIANTFGSGTVETVVMA